MNRFFVLFFLIPTVAIFAAPRHRATPTPIPAPTLKPEETGPSRNDLLLTVDHIVVLSQDLQRNLENEKAAHEATEVELIKGTKANADLQRQIDKQTTDFNGLKDQYATAMKKLWYYRVHWFLGWTIFILGILAGAAIWILKITGKLGLMAAKL